MRAMVLIIYFKAYSSMFVAEIVHSYILVSLVSKTITLQSP